MRKNMRMGKILAVLVSAALMLALLAGCGQSPLPKPSATPSPTPAPTPAPTPKPAVILDSLFPGNAPSGLADVLQQLNDRLYQDIGVKLQLAWTPESSYASDLDAALAAGKKIDFFWCGEDKLAGYAAKETIAPLDDDLAQFGQALTKNIGSQFFDAMKIGGKIMGVPSASNVPLCGDGHVLSYREDLRLKYSLPELDSVANIQTYLEAVHLNEPDVVPLVSNDAAMLIMPAFGPEELLAGTAGAVAWKANSDGSVTCVALQDSASFQGAAAKVREWYKEGLLPADAQDIKDGADELKAGKAAASDGAALSSVASEASISAAAPSAQLADAPVFGSQKVFDSVGGGVLCLVTASKCPEQVVQFWNWVLTGQENYDLYCFGIEGKNYKLDGDRITYLSDGYKTFPGWMFLNMNFERFPAGVSDGYIDTLRQWNEGATPDPLTGFKFDPSAVQAVLASVQQVTGTYGPMLNAGSAETSLLLAEFTVKMKAAGQDQIVAEAQKQIDAFLALKKAGA